MKNSENKISPLKLAIIIICSVLTAAAIIFVVVKFIKKRKAKSAMNCGCGCDCDDEWFGDDEDYLGDLHCDADDDIASAVEEAIDAVESVVE